MLCEQKMMLLRTKFVRLCLQEVYIGFRGLQFCSQIVRKQKKKHLQNLCKCLIFNVDQVGLEPTTSRL